ncbi:hypothetical protein BDA99DRAFT_538453 [Phascolomyces articulosus]|uniref:Uncharacterized protein n=1 Tax=Phascolomyces articulosus TaxID=60185 RepID=A0AAD5JY34_9FUNG|nr:hypothetical protein BDA99DRAFT_538453 [Phascolomyces articulosus]
MHHNTNLINTSLLRKNVIRQRALLEPRTAVVLLTLRAPSTNPLKIYNSKMSSDNLWNWRFFGEIFFGDFQKRNGDFHSCSRCEEQLKFLLLQDTTNSNIACARPLKREIENNLASRHRYVLCSHHLNYDTREGSIFFTGPERRFVSIQYGDVEEERYWQWYKERIFRLLNGLGGLASRDT